jgi:branched-chain amino acid transport system substrate-binding protein
LLSFISITSLVLLTLYPNGAMAASKSNEAGSLACKKGAITVGIAKAASGGASFFDLAGTRGLMIAIDEINAAGGIKGCKIKTISGDSKSDPAIAAEVAKSMVARGAQILVVPDDFDGGIAAAKVGQAAGVLTLSLAASSTQFGKAVGNLFFSGGITTTELGLAQARVVLDSKLMTCYQVIDPGLAYDTEQDTSFRKLYLANGGNVLGSSTADTLAGQTDYSAIISKIKAANPAVIQALMVFPGTGTFVKQLRAAGVTTPVVSNLTFQTRDLPKLVGDSGSNNLTYAEQVYFEGAGVDPKTDPKILTFTKEYQNRFGIFPEQANAPGAYQTFTAIAKALQQPLVVDAKTAVSAIRKQSNLKVPGGTLVGWKDGYAVWNPLIVGISNGKFNFLQTLNANDLRIAAGM